jgi:KDO2-lipid IV(A) lauroyltransferase
MSAFQVEARFRASRGGAFIGTLAKLPAAPAAPPQDPSTGGDSVPLVHFWRPRYWLTWVFVLWLRVTAALPWRTAIRLHKLIGRAVGALQPRRRAIVRRNLEICFPERTSADLDALSKRHFENIGAFLAEMAIAWFGDLDRLAGRFRIEGVEHVEAALARGKGVLLYSGHFTSLEICVPLIKRLVPLSAFMFRRRSNSLLTEIQRRGRRRTAHVSFANDDVRALLRVLARNATVWYAPDQARIDSGVLLPFFGEPSMTSTATSRVARHSGAAVIPLFYCRLPDDSGYVLRFHSPLDDLPSADAVRDTARLIAVLEDFVRQAPDQYFWTHRKFKGRPGDLPDAYERQAK